MSEQNSVGSMSQAIKVAQDAALAAIASASDLVTLRALSAELNKKDSPLNSFKSDMGKLPSVEDKRAIGQLLNAAATQIAAALEARTSDFAGAEIAARIAREALDLTELLAQRRRGHSHIVTQATQRLEDVFIGLGFQIAEGPEVETDFHNFEALNMPKSHPARSEFDTMFLEYGEPG